MTKKLINLYKNVTLDLMSLNIAEILARVNLNIKKPIRNNPVQITPKISDDYYSIIKELFNKKEDENIPNDEFLEKKKMKDICHHKINLKHMMIKLYQPIKI